MAVIEINRKVQAIEKVRIAKRVPPQIFIAHSSISKKLLENIKREIETEKVLTFIANQERYKTNFAEIIVQAISNSDALFAVLTKKAFKKQSTRDWIYFEIGLAKGMWKKAVSKVSNQYKIYVWKDVTINIPNRSPINIIEEYKPLKINSKKSKDAMLDEMKSIAHNISMKNF